MHHRSGQILAVDIAFNGYACNMHNYQYQREVGEEFMHFFPHFFVSGADSGQRSGGLVCAVYGKPGDTAANKLISNNTIMAAPAGLWPM